MGGLKLYKSYSLPTQRRNWHYFGSVNVLVGGGLGVLLQKILGLNGVNLCNSWQNKPENGSFKCQGWKVEFVCDDLKRIVSHAFELGSDYG